MAARAELISKVLTKLDEITVFEEEQEVPIVDMADQLLNESAINMLLNAPVHMLPSVKINPTSTTLNHFKDLENGWGYVGLPSNYLRLYRFKMAAWNRSVTEAISVHNPKYKLQHNKHTRGGIAKPVAAINQITVVNEGASYDNPDELILSSYIITEPLSGAVNGVNKVFSTTSPFVTNTLSVFLNGIRETHYSETTDTQITMEDAPKNIGFTDTLEIIYTKKQI